MTLIAEYSRSAGDARPLWFVRLVKVEPNGARHALSQWARHRTFAAVSRFAKDYGAIPIAEN